MNIERIPFVTMTNKNYVLLHDGSQATRTMASITDADVKHVFETGPGKYPDMVKLLPELRKVHKDVWVSFWGGYWVLNNERTMVAQINLLQDKTWEVDFASERFTPKRMAFTFPKIVDAIKNFRDVTLTDAQFVWNKDHHYDYPKEKLP